MFTPIARIPWDRHRHRQRHRHGHPRRLPREHPRAEVGVSGDFPVQLARSRTRTTILADLFADLSDTHTALVLKLLKRQATVGRADLLNRVNTLKIGYYTVYTTPSRTDGQSVSKAALHSRPILSCYYFAPWMDTKGTAMSMYVCLSVRSHLESHTVKLHQILRIQCYCGLWHSWLDPPLVALRYDVYFLFRG